MDAIAIKKIVSSSRENTSDPIKWILAFHKLAIEYSLPHKIIKGYLIIRNSSCYSYTWIEAQHMRFVPPSPKNSVIAIAIPRIQEHLYDVNKDIEMEIRIIQSGLKTLLFRTY